MRFTCVPFARGGAFWPSAVDGGDIPTPPRVSGVRPPGSEDRKKPRPAPRFVICERGGNCTILSLSCYCSDTKSLTPCAIIVVARSHLTNRHGPNKVGRAGRVVRRQNWGDDLPSAVIGRTTCRITKGFSYRIIRSCHYPAVAYLQALGFVTSAWTRPPGLHDAERPSLPPYRRERYPDAEVYLAGRPALVSALVRGMWYSGCEVTREGIACRPPSVWTATPSADGSHEIRLVHGNGGERNRFGGCPVSMIRGLGRGKGV